MESKVVYKTDAEKGGTGKADTYKTDAEKDGTGRGSEGRGQSNFELSIIMEMLLSMTMITTSSVSQEEISPLYVINPTSHLAQVRINL